MKGYRFDKGLCLKNPFDRRSNITAERFLGHYRFIPDSELPIKIFEIFEKYFNIVLNIFQNYFVQRGSQRSGCLRAALRARVDFATLRYMETSSAGGERRFGEHILLLSISFDENHLAMSKHCHNVLDGKL